MIRKYEEDDLESILDIWFASSSLAHPFLEDAFMAKERENIRDIYIPNTETWVFIEKGEPVAFISMIENEIGAVFVLPERHGKGIGTKLVNLVAAIHDELEVEVFKRNEIGRAFYDKYGFVLQNKHIHEETGNELLRLKFPK